MPRNITGNYNLPAGNPVVSGTIIESVWANTTLQDVANELSDSLSRSGSGGMLVPLRVPNGSAGAPTYTFSNDPLSGLYLVPQGEVRMAAQGVDQMRWINNDVQVWDNTDQTWYPIITGKDTIADVESQELSDGQTQITFVNNIAGAAIFINGLDADNGRLVQGVDYSYDAQNKILTLTESRPAGTLISAQRAGGFDPSSAQQTVIFDNENALALADLPIGTFAKTKGRLAAGDGFAADWYIALPTSELKGRDFGINNGNIAQFQTNVNEKSGRRNLLINGNFRIWQRNNNFTPVATSYTADRWVGGSQRTYTRVDDVPAGSIFKHSMYVQRNAAANMFCKQQVELAGQGVAGEFYVGQVLTCSGYIKLPAGKVIQLVTQFREQSSGGDIVTDLPATNILVGDGDWQYFTKTWTISATPSSLSRAYEISFTTNQDATIDEMYLTGIQLEIGQQATSYEDISIAELIVLCQRYYQKRTTGPNGINLLAAAYRDPVSNRVVNVQFPVKMRTSPTVGDVVDNGGWATLAYRTSVDGCRIAGTSTSISVSSSLSQIAFDAEL